MRYEHIISGIFLSRPNRFIAHVALDGGTAVCHVKNTGRCRELLVPGAQVYLQDFGPDAPGQEGEEAGTGQKARKVRKTRYDLIAVEKLREGGSLLINMDAQAPNKVFAQWAQGGHFCQNLSLLRPETVYGDSRFDFYYEAAGGVRGFVEVKGVTLEENGLALFPDAPTLRGVKHLEGLICAVREGYAAHVCFIIQMAGMGGFAPNDRTHPAFGQALRRAADAGVEVLALECAAALDRLEITGPVPVRLGEEETRERQRGNFRKNIPDGRKKA